MISVKRCSSFPTAAQTPRERDAFEPKARPAVGRSPFGQLLEKSYNAQTRFVVSSKDHKSLQRYYARILENIAASKLQTIHINAIESTVSGQIHPLVHDIGTEATRDRHGNSSLKAQST